MATDPPPAAAKWVVATTVPRDSPPAPFDVLVPPDPRTAVVAHVPHSSTVIPDAVRAEILLDDPALTRELVRLTDWHTDRLFSWLLDYGATMFVNRLSRLVFDPERFVGDGAEPMESVGQGVVYTQTTGGDPLRVRSAEDRSRRIEALYDPYHAALTALVAEVKQEFGHCLILDCHSFATVPLPSEADQSRPRPDICIGRDPFHTPSALGDALQAALVAEEFDVRFDAPFSGTLVPLRFYQRDQAVSSVMLEVRRGLYCDEATGELLPTADEVRGRVARAVTAALDAAPHRGIRRVRRSQGGHP